MASTFPSLVLASPRASPDCAARRGDGVLRVALASPATALPIGAVHLDHQDPFGVEVAGEAGAIAARALDPDELDLAEVSEPSEQTAVTSWRGLEGLNAEKAAEMVQGGGDMHVQVRVDTRGDPEWHRGHRHPFVGKRVGWHRIGRDDGQDSDGPLRQAPSRSLRPTGGCREGVRARPTDRFQDSPPRRQPA